MKDEGSSMRRSQEEEEEAPLMTNGSSTSGDLSFKMAVKTVAPGCECAGRDVDVDAHLQRRSSKEQSLEAESSSRLFHSKCGKNRFCRWKAGIAAEATRDSGRRNGGANWECVVGRIQILIRYL